MRSFEYDFQADSYVPIDRNVASEHITKTGVTQIAFQEGRPNILWAVKNDGTLIGMTLEEQEGVSGWHRHNTQGEIISIAAIPRSTNYHQLWMCVKRDGNYYIEYFSDEIIFPQREDYTENTKDEDDLIFSNITYEKQKEYIHLDSSLSYYGTSAGEVASAAIQPAASSGTGVTFTASASVFSSGDVGREIWKKHITGTESGRAIITGYTSGTVVTCEITENFDNTNSIPLGEWYLTTGEVSGLDHLEGLEVAIVTDGGQHSPATVVSGSVTLDRQSSVVHVGLAYTGYLETNDLDGGALDGTSQTRKKSLQSVAVRLFNSLYAKVGEGYYNLELIEMRRASMNMDRPPLLFTGDVKKTYYSQINDKNDGGLQRSKRVIVAQDQPYPCNVQLVVPYFTTT